MSLPSLSKDIITIVKTNGEIFDDIKANVQTKMIFIHDEKLPLEENDTIYRKLPSGLVEKYIVIDRGYFSGIGSIRGHYEAKVRKEGSINEEKYKSITNIYNVNGPSSKININSTDNSKNYFNDNDSLFEDLKHVLAGIVEENIKEKSFQILEKLNNSKNTPSYLTNYQNFISLLADHMTVIAPFIPALSKLL